MTLPPATPTAPPAPRRLILRPVDPGPPPADPGPIPTPGLENAEPGEDAAQLDADTLLLGELAAQGVNTAVRATMGAELAATDDEVAEVARRAQPVIVRAASRFGADAAGALPEWAGELIYLGAAVYIAWGDAAIEAWRSAIAARRAAREGADDDAEDGSAGDAGRDAGRGAGGDPGRRRVRGDAGADRGRGTDHAEARSGRPGEIAPGYGDRLTERLSRVGGTRARES